MADPAAGSGAAAPEDDPVVDMEAVSAMLGQLAVTKKKKKAGKRSDLVARRDVSAFTSEDGETVNFTYSEMLSRVYTLLHANNPDIVNRTRKVLRPPEICRVGSTRTAWVNFKEICEMLKRSWEHVLSFFLVEQDTTGAIDGSDRLLLRGRFLPKVIESGLRKYIGEYVMCNMCKSLETVLNRDDVSRLWFMNCKACGSRRSVPPIKAGFHAVNRRDRRADRQKQ